jgi:hypothetical protein
MVTMKKEIAIFDFHGSFGGPNQGDVRAIP